MAQLAVGGLESPGAVGHRALESLDVMPERAGVLPLAAERTRRLQDLDRLERLLDDDELVGMPEPCQQLQPVVIGVGGADHHLHLGVDLPELLDGLEPVPTGRHAHVDERHRIGPALIERAACPLDTLASLHGRIDIEARALAGRLLAEQRRCGARHLGLRTPAEDLAIVLVDARIVIDHEEAVDQEVGVTGHGDSRHERVAASA